MEISGAGKSPNTSLSFRYNANNEELEELLQFCEDDPPTPQAEPAPARSESASPKRAEKNISIIDKYFKSIRTEKPVEKNEDVKSEPKPEDSRSPTAPKEVTSSPMKEYLNRLGKRSTPEVAPEGKESNETWKIFHDFKFKIAQAVEDMTTRSVEDAKEKTLPRENSTSDSEENSIIKDSDQHSMGDTDNQVSSLDSSIQNLSDMTQPLTAKPTDFELSRDLSFVKNHSDSSDDTHKNLPYQESDLTKEHLQDSIEVESGIEALEDTIDAFGDVSQIDMDIDNKRQTDTPINQANTSNFGLPPSKDNLLKDKPKKKKYILKFSMYILTVFLFINFLLFPNSNIWNGFLLGIWFFCFVSNVRDWLLDNYFSDSEPSKGGFFQLKQSTVTPFSYTIPTIKEHKPLKKFEGWINHYRFPDYDPLTYHINKTTTAFVKLEGCNLRISYTRTKVAKRALWDEKIENVTFYQHRLYNLTGARVILMPKGLVKRRQWSKKYPICVILSEKETIQVLEKENTAEKKLSEAFEKKSRDAPTEVESTETNTTPEKKKKFVWRKKEKSITHSDSEPGREGLRHRLVRKMHREKSTEKKTDSTSQCTEPETSQADKNTQPEDTTVDREMEFTKSATSTKDDEEDIDDSELIRIKEFLEETALSFFQFWQQLALSLLVWGEEHALSNVAFSDIFRRPLELFLNLFYKSELETGNEGTTEGEWSVHVKHSKDKHSRLFLFARTGRDKLEWYRRLVVSSASCSPPESRERVQDGIELAVYKMTEKDTVAFAKTKTNDVVSEGVTISAPVPPLPSNFESYEKSFWPFLLKIIQTHETSAKQTADTGVMCQIEPTPHEKSKSKKKKKGVTPEAPCECRSLPAEVSWLNTMLARLMYDVMRDPAMVARVQNRIQRKLNTLKLPSFMSPLLVTELVLAGAVPLVRAVSPPELDARGVWLGALLRYDGGATITILTQINLLKLKEKNITLEDRILGTAENTVESEPSASPTGGFFSDSKKRKPAIYDSDVEDSAESSSDDESPPVQPVDSNESIPPTDSVTSTNEGGSSKKKFLRMVDKIATNKYFQQVTDYKYIKRAMEGLSNTDIKLQLEVSGLEGRLAINMPPPPHDRLWIGFSTNPQLVLKARPAVGARALRFAHISNWIEQKLTKEFEKVLVLPNMEDFIIDVMSPTPIDFE